MRTLIVFASLFLFGCTASQVLETKEKAEDVLFVGNSLTYVGNVPAIFSALRDESGKSGGADMIVRAGATLSERVADGSVREALAKGQYAILVLQERGGDLTCSFGPESCVQSRESIKQLAALGREKGARVVLLGTYQPNPVASRRIVEAESHAAAEAGIGYVEVSETFQTLRDAHPGLDWFAPDDVHPGPDLALLNALLIYQEVFGSTPSAEALTVRAPIYRSTSGLTEELRSYDTPPPLKDTPLEIHYPSETLRILLGKSVSATESD
ncbi:SGNH/GDSL hydrolase family protein [Microcoleus sp. Pol17_C1]|uniref:SGNH/GDSL hydrolase family protein n=1 Tax=Microcoleus sp. Pol17_C1 TaxID=2818881 RepID=UPI002FCECE71